MRAGMLVEPGGMRDAIERLLADAELRARLGAAARLAAVGSGGAAAALVGAYWSARR